MAKKNTPKNSAAVTESAARVLRDIVVDGIQYLCDQVVSFPELVLAGLVASGAVDPHPDAVAHCIDVLEKEIIVHESPVVELDEEPNDQRSGDEGFGD